MNARQLTTIGLVGASLAIAIAAVYAPVAGFDFVNWDDDQYIVENRRVLDGLTWDNVVWALTTTDLANWHPLTWWSHQLDCTVFGPRPGPPHVENVLWHLLNTLLVWRLGFRLCGRVGVAAWIAALFALHPLRVESVAWVSERKDLLSACFGLLAVLAYLRYVERPSLAPMFAVAALQGLSMLAKPMLVTLPALLLILDAWPLRRAATAGVRRLVLEKWPTILLSAVFCIIAIVSQREGGALQEVERFAWTWRGANVAQSYVVYLWRTIWPVHLACFYPLPFNELKLSAIGITSFGAMGIWSAILLVLVTVQLVRARRDYPFALAGWAWYLVALLPVIGIIQIGGQANADRYTYLPQLGILAAAVCALDRWTQSRPRMQPTLVGVGAVALLLLAWQSSRQVQTWRNSETLFVHCLRVTGDQALAHFNLGLHLRGVGRAAEAEDHYRRALALQSTYPKAHNNLGALLKERGELAAAIEQFRLALAAQPGYFDALMNLGQSLNEQGNAPEAVTYLRQAVELRPDDVRTNTALGHALANVNNLAGAESRLRRALQLAPRDAEATLLLGIVVARQGNVVEGKRLIQEAQRLAPLNSTIQQVAREQLDTLP